MFSSSRRTFLGASLAGLAAGRVLAADVSEKSVDGDKKTKDDPAFQPNTLFLTWQRDPTTTMTVQWVGTRGETADTNVHFAPLAPALPQTGRDRPADAPWPVVKTTAKPYPMTDFKVFRAELTGLTPGTDYQFRIGKQSPTYRFRTMPAKATDTIHFISGGDCGVNSHAVANNIQAARQDPMFAVDRRRPRLRQRPVGRHQPRLPAQLQQAHDRPRRPADPDGRLHRQPRGGRRLQQAAHEGAVLLRPLRRPVSRDRLRHARLRRLPQPGPARHRPHDADRRRPDRLAGEDAQGAGRPPERVRGQPRAGLSVVSQVRSTPATEDKPARPAPARTTASTGCRCSRSTACRSCWNTTTTRSSGPSRCWTALADANGVLYLGDGSWGRLRNPKPPEKLPYLAATSRDYHLSLHRIQGEERFHLALDEPAG